MKKKKEEEKTHNEEHKFRTSRKVYLPLYFMILAILGVIFCISYSGLNLDKNALAIASLFIFLIIISTEYHRLSIFYKLTKGSLVYSHGLISKSIKNIDYFAISDVDVHQSLWQRIFNFGDVNIRLFSTDTTTSVRNINGPENFARLLEEMITIKRRNSQKSGNARIS